MLPALRFGKMSTFAHSFNELNGYASRSSSSSRAVSACISPSTVSDGSRSRSRATARETFSASGWRTEPKFEKESIAIFGSMPSVFTMRAAA
jgi:hypothetical protein